MKLIIKIKDITKEALEKKIQKWNIQGTEILKGERYYLTKWADQYTLYPEEEFSKFTLTEMPLSIIYTVLN